MLRARSGGKNELKRSRKKFGEEMVAFHVLVVMVVSLGVYYIGCVGVCIGQNSSKFILVMGAVYSM